MHHACDQCMKQASKHDQCLHKDGTVVLADKVTYDGDNRGWRKLYISSGTVKLSPNHCMMDLTILSEGTADQCMKGRRTQGQLADWNLQQWVNDSRMVTNDTQDIQVYSFENWFNKMNV